MGVLTAKLAVGDICGLPLIWGHGAGWPMWIKRSIKTLKRQGRIVKCRSQSNAVHSAIALMIRGVASDQVQVYLTYAELPMHAIRISGYRAAGRFGFATSPTTLTDTLQFSAAATGGLHFNEKTDHPLTKAHAVHSVYRNADGADKDQCG
jgi:hypothetical protein